MSELYLNLIFTFPLILFGLGASYYDLKKNIIPNKILLFGYLWGGAAYLVLTLTNIFYFRSGVLFDYLPAAILNGLFAILLGFLFWKVKFWSAGDGKLFGLYGLLLPLEFYSEFYVNYFPAIVLAVNLIVPLLLLIITKALLAFIKERKAVYSAIRNFELTKEKLTSNGKVLFKLLIHLTFALTTIRILIFAHLEVFDVEPEPIILLAVFLGITFGVRWLVRKYNWLAPLEYAIILGYLGSMIATGDYQGVLSFIRVLFVFATIIIGLRSILLFYVRKKETREIKAKEVETGMVLTKEWRGFLSRKISDFSKKYSKEFRNLGPGGLSEKQAAIIRELFKDDENYKVEVTSSLSFAPFMLLAVMVSIITSSSFAPWIREFIYHLVGLIGGF